MNKRIKRLQIINGGIQYFYVNRENIMSIKIRLFNLDGNLRLVRKAVGPTPTEDARQGRCASMIQSEISVGCFTHAKNEM